MNKHEYKPLPAGSVPARKPRRVPVYTEFAYDKFSVWECWFFGFHTKPRLSTTPVQLQDGRMLQVGEILVKLGGKRTSAGFVDLTFYKGSGFELAGTFKSLDGDIVCFHQWQNGKRKKMTLDNYKAVYCGYAISEGMPGQWIFSTPAIAGRVVETECAIIKTAAQVRADYLAA